MFIFPFRIVSSMLLSYLAECVCLLGSLFFYVAIYFTSIGVISEFLFSSYIRGGDTNLQEVAISANAVSSGRLDMWVYSIERALESPVFGHGPSSGRWLFSGTGYGYAGQPHNVIIQFIMDFGFFGAAILCLLAAKILKRVSVIFNTSTRDELLRRSLVAFFWAYIIYSQIDGLFYHPLPMMNFAIILTLLMALHSSLEVKN